MNIEMQTRLVSSGVNWASLNVIDYWNELEDVIISSVDEKAPLKSFIQNDTKIDSIPRFVTNKINKRNRLLKSRNTLLNTP